MREVNPLAQQVAAKQIKFKSLLLLTAAFAFVIWLTLFYSKDKRNLATVPAAAHTTIAPAFNKPA